MVFFCLDHTWRTWAYRLVSGQLEVQMRRNRDSLTEEEDCPTSPALIRVSNLNNLKCLNQTASFELFHLNFFDWDIKRSTILLLEPFATSLESIYFDYIIQTTWTTWSIWTFSPRNYFALTSLTSACSHEVFHIKQKRHWTKFLN